MAYVVRHRQTGERRAERFTRYVDAFNAARAEGIGWGVVEE